MSANFLWKFCELSHRDSKKAILPVPNGFQNLNALVDTIRHEIIERYRPGEDDPHLKTLQAAHVDDNDYFSHIALDDISAIIRDIREAHKNDSESAPLTTVADELRENLEAVENFKGSRQEKQAFLYCKQLGINYKNLSEEEFRWLIRILQKSKKMGTPVSQRKKRKWKLPLREGMFLQRQRLLFAGICNFYLIAAVLIVGVVKIVSYCYFWNIKFES